MGKRWLRYLAVWAVCLAFFLANRRWMGWIVFVGVSALPWLSLIVSLPAMLLSRLRFDIPDFVEAQTEADLNIRLECPLPPPIWQVRVTARHSLTGERCRLKPGDALPTAHCGVLDMRISRGRVYDYLGLFFLPRPTPGSVLLPIRPQPLRPRQLPDLEQRHAVQWRPKAGGGFAENHELRLYRPGDSLRQIHWKLSGKTGKLIYREPMELQNNRLALRLVHGGSPEVLDRKLGRLLWLGQWLLGQGLAFDILAHTAEGQQLWTVTAPHALPQAMDQLLSCPPLEGGRVHLPAGSRWQYDIGGDADET